MKRPKLLDSFGYAFTGLKFAIRTQRSMHIHLTCMVIVFGLSAWLQFDLTRWAIVLLCVAMLIVTELLNTAVELVVDLASPGFHELAGKAKDVAAGAVFAASIFAVGIGLLLFGPPLYQMLLPIIGQAQVKASSAADLPNEQPR